MQPDNPLLRDERSRATFHIELLTNFFDGGKERTECRRNIEKLVLNDPSFDHTPTEFLSREEQYTLAVKKACLCVQKMKEHDLSDPYEKYYFKKIAMSRETAPLNLHEIMFIPTIIGQGTEEQQAIWLPKSLNFEIIGTYAQTEMGHGTFLRGIETTATYDPATEEFVINSPNTTSMKWWPGGLGKTSNHAIVAALLYTQGKCYGTHMFIMTIRDLETHQPMPGITLGDIGPKMGYGTIDNGFMSLNNVRIPRKHLLMKNAKVLPDGTYVSKRKAGAEKLTYGAMVLVRSLLVSDLGRGLGEAATIAVRYSAVRRQGCLVDGEETKILDFPTQQYKLVPMVATAYAFCLIGDVLRDMYFTVQSELEDGNVDRLPEMHALSAGLKALSSWTASAGVDTCRMACGGHGYSMASGIPKIWLDIVPACTYEGENTVMMLQTARYLLKCLDITRSNKPLPPSVAYITYHRGESVVLKRDPTIEDLLLGYRIRALRLIQEGGLKMRDEMQRGLTWDEAFQKTSVFLVKMAYAHCHFYVVQAFHSIVQSADDNIHPVLDLLVRVYALHGILENAGDFFEVGWLQSGCSLALCRQALDQCLIRLRPDLVPLVDAFDFDDRVLGSVLGRKDGHVYDSLLRWAQQSPLNTNMVHASYYDYLRPLMKGEPIPPKARL